MIVKLADLAKVDSCCETFSKLGRLNIVFDILNNLKDMNVEEIHSKWVSEAFKEGIQENDFLTAIHLQDLYSLTIFLHERDVTNALIHSIKKHSTYMEVKLVLIEMLLPRMPFDTVVYLSDNMDHLMESLKEDPRDNFMIRNNNPLLVCYLLYRLSQ